MSLGYGVVQLDVTIVNTALNSIGNSIGGDVSALQWVVSTYTIAFAALILTAGAIGDRIGAKRIFVVGFAIFTVASLVCALAPTIVVLIAARALQGVGAAVLVPNSLALLNHTYREEKARGRAIGIWAAGATLALTFGPLAGGGLIAFAGWRTIFLVNLPIGLIGLWLTWHYAAETPRSANRELDLPGQAAAIGALGALAGSVIGGGALGWNNAWVLAGLAAFLVIGILFIGQERRSWQPMSPAVTFQTPVVRSRHSCRVSCERCILRTDFRSQPLFSKVQWLFSAGNRSRLCSHDGRCSARKSPGSPGNGEIWRAGRHRRGRNDRCRRLRGVDSDRARHQLLDYVRPTRRRRWRTRTAGSAAHIGSPGHSGKSKIWRRLRRTERRPANRQRSRCCSVWISGRQNEHLHARCKRVIDYLRAPSGLRLCCDPGLRECARKRKRPQFPRFYETSDSELFSNGQRPVVRSNAKTGIL